MKIVILDGYTENPGDLSWAQLERFGALTVYDRTPYEPAEIIRRIGNAEIVITNKTPIGREVLDACPSVRFIAVLATGYNVVDVKYAREKGIPVSNVPAYGTDAVGQFAIALLLEICSHVKHHSDAVHAGRWQSAQDWTFWDYPLIELAGKTMGIIGFGRIGQTTGRIAKALDMKVLAAGSKTFTVAENPKPPANTVRVGVVYYINNQNNASQFQLHYWGPNGLVGDAACVRTSSTAQVSVGSQFWNGAGTCQRTGSGRRAQRGEGSGCGAGRGFHRTDPGRQSAPDGEKLSHHTAYLLGAERGAAAHPRLHGRESACIP